MDEEIEIGRGSLEHEPITMASYDEERRGAAMRFRMWSLLAPVPAAVTSSR